MLLFLLFVCVFNSNSFVLTKHLAVIHSLANTSSSSMFVPETKYIIVICINYDVGSMWSANNLINIHKKY